MRLIFMTAPLRMRVSLVIYFLGIMLAMRGTADDKEVLPSIELKQSQTSPVIAKTVVSSRLRFVIVVGLEGAGHHYFDNVLRELFKHDHLVVISSCSIAKGIYMDRALGQTVSEYGELRDEMRSGMKAIAEREEHLEAPGTIVAVQGKVIKRDGKSCPRLGEVSFPNGHGPNKVLKYADIQQVAQLAEEEGVDLRMVYLQRSAKAMLLSSTVHRSFQNHLLGARVQDNRDREENFLEYVQIIIADAGVMHSLLSELDPGFFICHYFNEIGNKNQTKEIADFLAPSDVVSECVQRSMWKNANQRHSGGGDLQFSDSNAITERLQRKLDVIEERLCGAQASWKR